MNIIGDVPARPACWSTTSSTPPAPCAPRRNALKAQGARKVAAYCTTRCCRARAGQHRRVAAGRTGGDRHHPAARPRRRPAAASASSASPSCWPKRSAGRVRRIGRKPAVRGTTAPSSKMPFAGRTPPPWSRGSPNAAARRFIQRSEFTEMATNSRNSGQSRNGRGEGCEPPPAPCRNRVPAIVYGGNSTRPQHPVRPQRLAGPAERVVLRRSSTWTLDGEASRCSCATCSAIRSSSRSCTWTSSVVRERGDPRAARAAALPQPGQVAGRQDAGRRDLHELNEVEVVCRRKDLPEFIEVDLSRSPWATSCTCPDVKLPTGVELPELKRWAGARLGRVSRADRRGVAEAPCRGARPPAGVPGRPRAPKEERRRDGVIPRRGRRFGAPAGWPPVLRRRRRPMAVCASSSGWAIRTRTRPNPAQRRVLVY